MKHIKLFEEFINTEYKLNDQINESSPAFELLASAASVIIAGGISIAGLYIIEFITRGIKIAKDLAYPDKFTKFTTELSKDKKFNKKFIELMAEYEVLNKPSVRKFAHDIVEFKEFQTILDKHYPKMNNYIEFERNQAVRNFKEGIVETIKTNGNWLVKTIKKKFPELKDLKMESEETFVSEKSGDSYSYGCVMLYFNFPKMNDIHSKIDEKDLYEEEGDRTFGLEDEPHITLLYGLEDSVTPKEIKEILDKFTFGPCKLHNASLFENEYDVLKFDVRYPTKGGAFLHKCNTALRDLPYQNDYPDYHPHMTIGYLKKGTGKKYTEMLKDEEYDLVPTHAVFSQPDGTKTKIKINTK